MTDRGNKHGGFTLVEVLVSLTILSMVLALLLTGLRMGGRSLQAVELQTEQSEIVFQSQRLLRDLLEQIDPYMEEDERGRKTLVFTGEQRQLDFVAPATRNLGWAGLLHYRLELKESASEAGGVELLMSYWPSGLGDQALKQQLPIMSASADSRFVYFGQDASGRSGWHSQWRDPDSLPEVIGLTHGQGGPAAPAKALPPDMYAVTRTSWYGRQD